MANVLNRTTGEYLESVNTPEYDPKEWIINPDVTPVQGYPAPFWVINSDDTLSVASPAEQLRIIEQAPYRGLTLEQAQASKRNEVNIQRDIHLNGGWLYKGVVYDSDATSKQNISGIMTLINTGSPLPSDFTFRAQDNSNVPYNNATFTEFFQCSCVWAEMIYRTSWYHKANIDALTDVPSVAAYNTGLGWPAGYSGAQG
jgi:hypothetical protein